MFQDLEQLDYDQLEKHVAPLMHVICLVWANSEHYNVPARIVVLLQETFNLIIEMVRVLKIRIDCRRYVAVVLL